MHGNDSVTIKFEMFCVVKREFDGAKMQFHCILCATRIAVTMKEQNSYNA